MKTLVTFLFACFLTSSFSQNISPQFSELKGLEDQTDNTHLFYRIYSYSSNGYTSEWNNSIYHFDLAAEVDTGFLGESGVSNPAYNFDYWISDLDFWNNNPAEFIYCGGFTFGPYNEGSAYVQRFDGFYNSIGYIWGSANYIDIKPTNDSLLYLGVLTYGGFQSLTSSDGGRNWDTLLTSYQFLSLNPYHENIERCTEAD